MASEPQGRPPELGVTDADLDEQAELPSPAGLERPARERHRACCPTDGTDVTGSLKGHHVDGAHLVDRRTQDVEVAPVFGYRCPYCRTVLAVDPSSGAVDLPGPGTGREGWLAVRAAVGDGHGYVLVPWEVARP